MLPDTVLPDTVRVSWPAIEGVTYELWSADSAEGPWTQQVVPSRFPEGGVFRPPGSAGFYQVRRLP